MTSTTKPTIDFLRTKAHWVWRETVRLHGLAPETRIASSLSMVEILTCLFYGGILRYRASQPRWANRDRLIISKAHGAVAIYPILADLGFLPRAELNLIGRNGSRIGAIPDPVVPGIETVNGSLGHGLGVACGIAMALALRKSTSKVFVVVGDGELHEGANWEALMFAGHRTLTNLFLIVDNNKRCMLDTTARVLTLTPLHRKLESFGWEVMRTDGHSIEDLLHALRKGTGARTRHRPLAIVANTVKGHGILSLEQDRLCHVRSLSQKEIAVILGEE